MLDHVVKLRKRSGVQLNRRIPLRRRLCFFAFVFLFGQVLMSQVLMSQQRPVPVEDEPHHHVVLKNEFVLVMHVTLAPGESTLFHTHSHDRVAVDLSDTRITQQKLGGSRKRATADASRTCNGRRVERAIHSPCA